MDFPLTQILAFALASVIGYFIGRITDFMNSDD
jgi:hypothetical protein